MQKSTVSSYHPEFRNRMKQKWRLNRIKTDLFKNLSSLNDTLQGIPPGMGEPLTFQKRLFYPSIIFCINKTSVGLPALTSLIGMTVHPSAS